MNADGSINILWLLVGIALLVGIGLFMHWYDNPPTADKFPRAEGDVIVIGPECFASADESVICWKGENYYKGSLSFGDEIAARIAAVTSDRDHEGDD